MMIEYLNHRTMSFGPFRTTTATRSIGFEEFLRLADQRPESDPGAAMVAVLREHEIPGINLSRYPDPTGCPRNLLPFLRRIAADGAWSVNLSVTVR
jgi:hypothetical protein